MSSNQWYLRYVWVLNLALLFLLAFFLSSAFHKYTKTFVKNENIKPTLSPYKKNRTDNNYKIKTESITSRDIFKASVEELSFSTTDDQTDTSVAQTKLKLKLLGIFFQRT